MARAQTYLVQVSQEDVLSRSSVVGGLVVLEGFSSTTIEEVDRLGYSADIGRFERSVKVLE